MRVLFNQGTPVPLRGFLNSHTVMTVCSAGTIFRAEPGAGLVPEAIPTNFSFYDVAKFGPVRTAITRLESVSAALPTPLEPFHSQAFVRPPGIMIQA